MRPRLTYSAQAVYDSTDCTRRANRKSTSCAKQTRAAKRNSLLTTRYHGRILAVYALVLLGAGSGAAGVRDEDYAARFDQIWRTTQQRFYDRNMAGLDWQAVADQYRPKARSAVSRPEFEAVVNRMLGELHASHTGYYTDDDMEFYLLKSLFQNDFDQTRMTHIGVMGVRKDGAFIVKAMLDGGSASQGGIRYGDRILDVEGRPFTTVGAFRNREGMPVKLSIDRPGTGRLTIAVTPVRENPQRAFLEATEKSVRIIEHGGKRFGYVHLWAMTNDRFRQALDGALTGALAKTDGLVLDLRDGFGGHPFGFTDVLFRPDIAWTQTPRNGPSTTSRIGYGKPIVVVVNEGTRSAKESFAYQMKKTRRGPLVGTTTAGAFLGAGGFPIGSDGYLELPVVDLALDGKRLEGVGVPPDITVEASDSYGPNDRQLARALEVLEERVRQPAAVAADRP